MMGARKSAQTAASNRRIPRAVWLITALFGLILFGYSVIFPVYRGPDEPHHVDLILEVRDDFGYPEFDERTLSRALEASLEIVRFGDRSRHLRAAEAVPRQDRPSFDDLGPDVPGRAPNQISQHPPLYYGLLAAESSFVGAFLPTSGEWPFDRVVATLRLLNLLLVVPLPLLGYLLVRRLGGSESAGLTAAIVPLGIPQLAHIGSVVNNDNLLTLLVGSLTVILVGVAQGDRSTRTALLAGSVGGLALLTKGFGLFVPLWIIAAYLVSGWPERTFRPEIRAMGMSLGVALGVGAWWWLRNLFVFGTLQPGIPLLPPAGPGFQPELLQWAVRFMRWMVERFWGWFGWFDVRMASPAIATASAVLAAGVSWGVARLRRSVGLLVVLAFPAVALVGLAARNALSGYLRTGSTPAIQGRYLFPAVVALAALAGMAFGSARSRWIPVSVLMGAGAMHAIALASIASTYWGAPGAGVGSKLDAILAWSPWPESVLFAAGGGLLVGIAFTFYALLRIEASSPDSPGAASLSRLAQGQP